MQAWLGVKTVDSNISSLMLFAVHVAYCQSNNFIDRHAVMNDMADTVQVYRSIFIVVHCVVIGFTEMIDGFLIIQKRDVQCGRRYEDKQQQYSEIFSHS